MIYYVGYYVEPGNPENRRVYLSAVNKMTYVIHSLQQLGLKVEVVSRAMSKDKKAHPGSYKQIDKNIFLKHFWTFGTKNIFMRALDLLFSRIWTLIYLLRKVKSTDTLLVYHSASSHKMISLIKKIKRCHLVIEVEEIYGDVSGDKRLKKRELALCEKADAFIFPTKLLSKAVNKTRKPYILIHGTYGVEPDRKVSFDDDKIHVVYAGIFDPRKGGMAAVAAAEYLSPKYHVHILGFGSEKEIAAMKETIKETNDKGSATVTYDGLLSGDEYIKFLQKCHIGLSPQNPDADFNATSFPSKILSYMSNGLRVVTVRIPAIESSEVGEDLYYYDKQTPEEIARAIMQVNLDDGYDSRRKIAELDKKFCEEIQKLVDRKNDKSSN